MKKGQNSFSNLLKLFMNRSHSGVGLFLHCRVFRCSVRTEECENLSFVACAMVDLEDSISSIKRIVPFYFILGP